MNKLTLKLEKREVRGKKVERLRKQGIVPATLYGLGTPSDTVSVSYDELRRVFLEAGETGLVEVELDGVKTPVLISSVSTSPVTGEIIHADFRRVNLKVKVKANVPVELTGESPAEKSGLGTVVLMVSELEVEALPGDLPESFLVDISVLLEADQVLTVADLKIDSKKIEILSDHETIIAKVEPPQEEVAIESEAAPVETETTVQKSEEAPKEEN
jgi:large subunit ribosomal protein L25